MLALGLVVAGVVAVGLFVLIARLMRIQEMTEIIAQSAATPCGASGRGPGVE